MANIKRCLGKTPEIPEKGTENEADSRIQWPVLLDHRRQLNPFGESMVEVRMARSWWLPGASLGPVPRASRPKEITSR
jgi:hypothetical protein